MPILNASILKQTALKQATIDVPEWSGSVILRELTGAERSELMVDTIQLQGALADRANLTPEAARKALALAAEIVRRTWIDENGNQAVQDVAELMEAPWNILFRLATEAMILSKMVPNSLEAEKKI
jgi:predicted solute-binding protein